MIKVESNLREKPNETESRLGFTAKEFNWWAEPFWYGQRIFDQHVGNTDKATPLHIVPSYNGNENKITYVEEIDLIYVCTKYISSAIASLKKHRLRMESFRTTNPHLIRLGICTRIDVLPVFTGIEERAHAYFHKHVKKTLKAGAIKYTGLYDGSDFSEEYAFQQIATIILNNKDLPIFPLPSNFNHKDQSVTKL
ncbi:MAG: hypothetical protein COZ34_02680 [Candidatus Pacebacteria bacterium CG_4_10_14_3_um_filter_34_15]|nr:hypothetical protein [Candidatus Pacearchaeota archaeon]NCQ66081.1 hypothetical protein [Candidatus Paceibacterota bacterium]OIO45224.1 MAG: hypothetical protein AUJ41_00470 [Candidatus Pacebacteria bacterium CG1_02_43_31]PIQ81096.1 MAG: hypothetical protein COV78_02115 [Candidatus Pacebacteria bacterium CG11_big_fil_rev_8_21_14_0_20_34_55]PIX81554.1 MAG: hypothetical protein COZ34_02680 [Candidatus Pacebacteria bacterium CG_4_10_14_3_um_filter_34_15]PJC43941.1 MAG: hypothetical protein CO0